ncbi:IucA/IucC family siderophore biosynthesis protein [Natrinema thermotolerans]|uniref:IucA/IucC family siderophore biosynthesis protein n=1 Tax=Natrinema thermotolerans TaxID=121872 RepID=A0AAF0PI93_9EURY|nr:IucA/IucC family siderophore biosynthesis protein [Natrinema thermotolerans]QCC58727.1 IucA/IucC family siderophore biosynthesis protein [Natrinema thermotolerans]WMT09879.1 IucA/IucC family siderophore biosynthesis protein [Natrinema thermotolerans]
MQHTRHTTDQEYGFDGTDTLETVLTEARWDDAGRELLAKIVREFTYEDILEPEPVADPDGEWTTYEADLDGTRYRFDAVERFWDSISVRVDSLERDDGDGFEPAADPLQFVVDLEPTIEMDSITAGHLVREYTNTLLADAHIDADDGADADAADATARSVLDMPYAEIEGEMTGHPWLTFNKGRVGWGYDDYRDYAPERSEPIRLSWCGVSREAATFVGVSGLDHEALLEAELGDYYGRFRDDLADRGLDPDDYLFLPVHDWQWENAIVPLFGRQLATNDIVPLGPGPDEYLPMQSVRTFVNADEPAKHNVKLPLQIVNTLVWRGLPGERTEAAPLVTEYVKDVRDSDPFLRDECELVLPGEIAGVNFDHPTFDALEAPPYQYNELLGCVWRESVTDLIDDDQRAMSLAALLHVEDGEPVVSKLVERSDLSLSAWLDELFETMLPPLLHYLYRYGTAFSPHGENTILVLEDDRPARLAVKDFVDDVNVADAPLAELQGLPEDLDDVLLSVPPEELRLFVVYGLFVGVYRYLADLLARHHDYPETEFWGRVRAAIEDYHDRFPDLEERFELFDLLEPSFPKLTLNRNRIVDVGYGDLPERPHAIEHGTVPNPLAEVDPQR